MKISLPQAFVGLAVLVGLCWGAIEVLLRLPAPDTSGGDFCRVTELETLKGNQPLRFVGDSLFTYSENDQKIVAYSRPLDGTRELRKIAEREVFCKEPSYQCFNVPKGEERPALEFATATDSEHFLARFKAHPETLFPVHIQNQNLQLAPPVGLCKNDGVANIAQFFWLRSRLGYFDSEKNRLSLWTIDQYPGSVTQAVAREPDEVWSFEPDKGFSQTSCDDLGTKRSDGRSYALSRVDDRSASSNMIEFISDSPQGSTLWSLSEDHPSLAIVQPIKDIKVQKAFRARDKNLYVVTGNPSQLFKLKTAGTGLELGAATLAPFAASSASISLSDDGGAAIVRQARLWLTAPKNYLVTKDQTASVLNEGFEFKLADVTPEILMGTAPRFHWLRSEPGGLHLREINCGKN